MKDLKNLEMTILDEAEVAGMIDLNIEEFNVIAYQLGFPPPIEICGQEVGWAEQEVKEWMWIKAIEASWSRDSRWGGETYSSLRNPSNLFDLNSLLLLRLKAYLRMIFHEEGKELGQTLANPADPFGDSSAIDVAKI